MNEPRLVLSAVRRRAVAATLAVLVLTAPSGCDKRLFSRDEALLRYDPRVLGGVDPVELPEFAERPPYSIEEGTAEAAERLRQPQPLEGTVPLELAGVRAAALEHNLDLRVELYNPTIAAAQVSEEEAKFEWTFFGSYDRLERDSPTPLATESSQFDSNRWNFGLDIPLQTGGTITASVPFNDDATNNLFALVNPSYAAAARFSISQPLLRNAGFRTNTASIRIARYQSQIADARTKLEAIRILANADRAYWLYYAAQRELAVQRQRYELALEQLETARRLVAAGKAAEVDVIRAEAGVADTLSSIITADTALRIRLRDLKRVMNRPDLPMDSPANIEPATQPSPVGLDLDPERLAEQAVANRMEMLELELQLAIDATNVDFQRNQALPLFVLDFNYAFTGLSDSYSSAFDQVGERSFDEWGVGLRGEIPIGNEAAKSRVHQAILTRVQRMATRDLRRQVIRQEVLDAVDRLREQWLRILAARQQVLLSGRTYEAEKRQFELGLRTSTDVLDAATRLADAQTREVAALADYQIAQVDIAFATGTLLGNGRVEWQPRDAGR